MKAFQLHMGPAKVALDLGDGSERGEYVSQDVILHTLGRPHRAINLMYCYYPLDKGWPARASDLPLPDGKTAGFAWDYAYDDYFPYQGGLEGDTSGEPFGQMRDVRRHGQDVILTLTCDCAVSDAQIIRIAEDLRPFGRLMLRVNHEATGNWFAFNKRYTYQEVADFFSRFHRLLKQHAPHIRTILCVGEDTPDKNGQMPYEDEFAEAIALTDMWSTDTYLALHWGWPFDIAEPGGSSHKRGDNGKVLRGFNFEYERFMARGENKARPFVISEFNADGDVTGPYEQAEQLLDFYRRLPEEAPCVTGVTFYQFRDRGRLGLEIEDPNNPGAGVKQPALDMYREVLSMAPYLPVLEQGAEAAFPARLRWGGSEDADGLAIPLTFEKDPVFCEVMFEGEDAALNLMMELNGRWFYKKTGVKHLDLMPAFFEARLSGKTELPLRIFAPPPDGVNDPAQGPGWEENYYATLRAAPQTRIRYAPAALAP
ncbi:MAG: hypothetical protein FWG72_05665 [Oscillospiraceae bacterium]|nr:hypothetical protein [Oscillospiraceae bacterium]